MEIGDCSLWHHLIFCEELENDEENNVVCWLCKEAVLGGPVYKCLECNFLQHKSCTEGSDMVNVEIKHDLNERHHLMFIKELNNEVVCPGCKEPASGPAYKCSFPRCTFFLHKSCIELSHVTQHPVHPEHTLFLQVASSHNYCDACRKCCEESFFYRCSLCDYDVDVICASRWRINADDCQQHSLFPMNKQVQFTCQACGEESKHITYLCSICRLLIDSNCVRFPLTIKTRTHDHSLTRTYSLRLVEQQDNVFCKLCRKKVNTEYAAYYCRNKCDYIAHLNCASRLRDEDKDQSATTEADAAQLVHLVEGINLAEDERADPREIKHISHPQHNLILSVEELMDDMRCEACMQFIISIPFYGCAQCKFFLHYRCVKLPATIKRGLFHKHPLTLLSQVSSTNGLLWCGACRRFRHGFAYKCDSGKDWFSFSLDVQCCLIPEILKHEGHEHSLFLAMRSWETCNGCGEKGVDFVCTNCDKFTLCIRCITLPLIAKYEYDTHLLKLSYTRENDFEEYYCLVCEEERDHPDHWFYYCEKCKLTAHIQCILGKNSSLKFGSTFTDEDHEHPLTIVEKTKHSPPCDACGKSFIDVAFECTECKFIVHPSGNLYQGRDCLRKLGKKRVK